MGSLLARVLFTAFGVKVDIKTILKIILILVILAMIYLAYRKVSDHFVMVKNLEENNTILLANNAELQQQKISLEDTIMANQKEYDATLAQRAQSTTIANNESKSTAARAASYQGIRDVINKVPSTARPVDPLVSRTLDQLWSLDTSGEDSK